MNIWNFIDERKILNKFLKNKNTLSESTYQKLIVYIKYLKEQGKNKIEIRNELDDLMHKYYPAFVFADWDNTLNSLVNKYIKPKYREFRQLKDIRISKQELEFIKSQNEAQTEKLLFILLVLAKGGIKEDKCELWVNIETRSLFKLAKYKLTTHGGVEAQRDIALYELGQKGLLSFPKYVTATGIKLNYGQSIVEDKDLAMKLNIDQDNIEDLVLEYLYYIKDETIIKCENCGKLVKTKNKKAKTKAKYCEKCAKEIKNKQNNSYRK